ncbi:MAG: YiiX/YebB-like N1pC/P60 family cysteine hydrolase [Candidatus Ozemobacteraceae bacterium]
MTKINFPNQASHRTRSPLFRRRSLTMCGLLILCCWFATGNAAVLARQLASDSMAYKVANDYCALHEFAVSADALRGQMEALLKEVKPNSAFSIFQEEQFNGWMFSYISLRKAFLLMAKRWHDRDIQKQLTRVQKENVLMISFAALLEWYRLGVWCVVVPQANKTFAYKLNEAVPEIGIGAGTGNQILETVGDGKLREKIEHGYIKARKIFQRNSRPESGFQKRIRESYEYIDAHEPPLFKAKWKAFFKTLCSDIFDEYYDLEVGVYTWVGDTKYRPRKPSITYDRIQEMKAKLQPGDVMFERENWFMSNIFLPGFWPHSILYVGTIDDLRKMGLDANDVVSPHLATFALPDEKGHERRVLEAISEGVMMNSMEDATDADYICALRPRLSKEEIKQVIINAFSYVGRPYDFEFDFQTTDKLVCSELIYRSFKDKLGLSPERIMGRWSMPSLTFVKKFSAERGKDDRLFDFNFFLDSDVRTQKTWFSTEDELAKSIRRPGFDVLLKPQSAPSPREKD